MLKWLQSRYKHYLEKIPSHEDSKTDPRLKRKLANSLYINHKRIVNILGDSEDIVFRELKIHIKKDYDALIIYTKGLIKKDTVHKNILKPLMYEFSKNITVTNEENNILDLVQNKVISVGDIEEAEDYQKIVSGLFTGSAILLINGQNIALSISCKGWESRGISEPENDVSIRGSHEGFTENIRTNTALLRRRIKNHNLRIESFTIGRYSKTKVCLAYIKGVTNEKLVDEARMRISKIDIDGIVESGYVEQYISDSSFTIFPTMGNTEKPDIVAAKMLEGRIAIITDGTPTVLTAPYLFIEAFQSPSDYFNNYIVTSTLRIIRWLAYFLAIGLPGLYVAAQAFHYEMIPTKLLFTIAAAREGVPFSAVVETLLMNTFFVILREAGIRMPRAIGTATSIVGALVLGDAAITAGLVGAPAVMVTAVAGLCTFVIPVLSGPSVVIGTSFIILGGSAGIYGISLGLVILLSHMSSLTSFGVAYMAPLAPFSLKDQRDEILKAPIWADLQRPSDFGVENLIKQSPKSAEKPLNEGNFKIKNTDDHV